MLKFLRWFFGLFSPYVNATERRVDKFFRHVKSTDSISDVRGALLKLMQNDLIVTNVWLERKFKGYEYLTKPVRKQMYSDVEKIKQKFLQFCEEHKFSEEQVRAVVKERGLSFPNGATEEMIYLFQIMAFLRPGLYYRYIKTASFGKLLRDPDREKLEGDCNQIVTLYIFMYSLKYSIEDLRIKLLPEHVCLHFRELDIEATTAEFRRYKENLEVLPVTEIISTNLLDLADFREEVQSITPRDMVKSAQLAYAISSLKSLVAKNLDVAYHNLAASALKINNFETAIFYISKTDDREALLTTYKNAALYYMKSNNFNKASFYAQKSGDRAFEKSIRHNEAVYYYKQGNYERALDIFSSVGNEEMKKACYAQQYKLLQTQVAADRTMDDVKRHKSTYQKMLDLARKMGDSGLERSLRETLAKL